MTLIKNTFIILFIAFLASCANHKSYLKENTNDETKILVISGYSDIFRVGVIGTTIFTNHNSEFKNLNLNTNEVILNSFKSGFNSVKFEAYDGETTFDFTDGNWYTGNGFNIKKSLDDLKIINQKYNSQYLLLIGPETSTDSAFFTGIGFEGFGVKRRYFMGDPNTVIYVSMKMALLDTSTFKIVKTVSNLEFQHTGLFPKEKIHKLERDDFLVLKDAFQTVFNKAINGLVERL